MSASAVEAEATGQEFVTAEFGGHGWRIPLDVDSWPINPILGCLGVDDEKRVKVNHFAVSVVLQLLLADQWDDFTKVATKRRDWVPASHMFAAAVGIARQPGHPLDLAFGSIPRLLFDLQQWPDAVEATLGDLGIDYRDRYRFDAGRRRLTLRQIHVRLRHAPFDCALNIAKNDGRRPPSDAALAVYDLYEHLTGHAHPSRPLSPKQKAAREAEAKALAEERAKYRKRHPRNRVNTALDTARTNAQPAQREVAHAH